MSVSHKCTSSSVGIKFDSSAVIIPMEKLMQAVRRREVSVEDTGVFNMDLVSKILECKEDLSAAKILVSAALTLSKEKMKSGNVEKVRRLAASTTSVPKLAQAVANFMLSYQDLAVIGNKRR